MRAASVCDVMAYGFACKDAIEPNRNHAQLERRSYPPLVIDLGHNPLWLAPQSSLRPDPMSPTGKAANCIKKVLQA